MADEVFAVSEDQELFQLSNGRYIMDEDQSRKMFYIKEAQPERSHQASGTGYSWDESGMAELFSECYQNDTRYCPETKCWFTYSEGAWRKDIMGIDPAEWMKNQGVFNTIITGFGVAGDKAAYMSKNLTQLAYDLSSFYNISFAESMQKVQSGIAGELEPLRRLGYDLSVARLEQERLNLGIDKSVSSMTQAEKSQFEPMQLQQMRMLLLFRPMNVMYAVLD